MLHAHYKFFRRLTVSCLVAGFGFAVVASAARAEEYPKRPITLVAAFGPGGTSDITTRVLAVNVAGYLSQPVLVVNKSGAGGAVGTAFVRNAKPDGYTLLLGRVATHAVSPAMKNLPYKYSEFTFLGLLDKNPFVCVSSAKKPYRSFGDLVKAVKANPGKISYSSPGVGTLPHLMGAMIMDEAGVPDAAKAVIHVPFKGEGNALAGLLSGKIDYMCLNLAPAIGHLQAGRINPLFITMPERVKSVPDIPTARELGYPGLEVAVGWSAVVGPPNMDAEATKTWVEILNKLKGNRSWVRMTQRLGSIPSILPPDETKKFIDSSYKKMNDLVSRLGMRIKK